MIAYCILAHNNPKHLHRLITAIDQPYAKVFLNLDTFYPTEFSELCLSKQINNPQRTGWADWNTIKATINLLEYGVSQDVTHIVLLSGSDYPIVKPDYINDFFNTNEYNEFISCEKLPWPEGDKPAVRIPKDFNIVYHELDPYCGYAYWAITKDAARHVLDRWKNDRRRLFLERNTIFPVEFYFQTMLAKFSLNTKHHLMYYNHIKGKHGPEVLTADEYQEALNYNIHTDAYGTHECLFARKFNDESTFLD